MRAAQLQATKGVSVEEGQRVRDYMQSLVRGPVEDFWPKVMISYATGTRDLKRGCERDLDGDGCGPGMQYANLLARALDRRGISCFSGLHVAGGQNWRQVKSPACEVYAQKQTSRSSHPTHPPPLLNPSTSTSSSAPRGV